MIRILIVEDNPANMKLAVDILESRGYEVLQAEDADRGIDIARDELPDLILMDIQLPGTDGLTATRMLRQLEPTRDIPIVAVTAHAMQGDEQRILEAGCDAYLSKPIRIQALLDVVREMTEGRT